MGCIIFLEEGDKKSFVQKPSLVALEMTVLTDASIFTKYYLNILLYFILYTFKIYFFTKLIWAFIQRISTKWFYYLGSYIKHKQKLWLETPGALLEVTTPKAADCQCHTSINLDGRKHIRSTKSFWRTLLHQSL